MELEIYRNTDLGYLGTVDIFESLIWHRKFFQPGVFEIYAPITINNIYLLKKYNLVYRDNDTEIGYINNLEIDDTLDEGEMIKASGMFLAGVFSQRIIAMQTGMVTFVGAVYHNCTIDGLSIIGGNTLRAIPKLTFGTFSDNPEVPYSCYFKNLGKVIEALARAGGFGYTISFDKTYNRLRFSSYRGADRSENQTANPQVVFCEENGNLYTSKYTDSDVGAVDTVYGWFDNLSKGNPILNASHVGNGINIEGNYGYARNEVAVVKSASMKDVTIPDSEDQTLYRQYTDEMQDWTDLDADVHNALVPVATNLEGDVGFESGYKTDYDLGDIVTVKSTKWGISMTQRIHEITEVFNDGKDGKPTVVPLFGSPAVTIMDILK